MIKSYLVIFRWDKEMPTQIAINKQIITDFCRRNHILKLSLFGSVLTGQFKPESDVDVLMVYDPQFPVGFRIFRMEEELSKLFDGHKVDIVNEKYINPRMREQVLTEAEVLYAQK